MKESPARPDDARGTAKPRRGTEGPPPRLRIESVRSGASGVATIAAGGSSFCLRAEVAGELGLDPARLVPGAELLDAEIEAIELASESYAAERRALALIAREEHSTFMLKVKLEKRGFSARAARLALDRLHGSGLLDDARFGRFYALSRLRRRAEGPTSLEAALRQRGVDPDTARSVVAELIGREGAPEARREAMAKAAARELKRSRGDRDAARERLRALGYGSSEIRDCLDALDPDA